jgi:hypothetical protein
MNTVNIESKNILARLMATENLAVQHKNVATASFDVKNRVLNLPIWQDMNDTLYEGLIGHEVGHALYTPHDEWVDFIKTNPGLKDYANVIEDARIEKKMKGKFPGMRKVFYGMYDELNRRDFFGTGSADLTTYGILDRINLHFKLGARAEIEFSDEEQLFVDRVAIADTFEEVLELSLELGEIAKNEKLNTTFDDLEYSDDYWEEGVDETEEPQQQISGDENGKGDDDSIGETDDTTDETDETDETEEPNGVASPHGNVDEQVSPPESETQRNFDESMGSLNDETAKTPIYVSLPNVHTKDITVDYKTIGKLLGDFYSIPGNYGDHYDFETHEQRMKDCIEEIKGWKKDTLPVVNYMVKEFEMKQSASAHRRTSTAKTGVLDTNKMHSYSYNEDIFKRVASVKDGKNHALIMYVDWSASMQDKLVATVKQTLTLVMFARKVGIPFRVYGFTNGKSPDDYQAELLDTDELEGNRARFYDEDADGNDTFSHLWLGELNLLEFFNEKMTAKEFNDMIANFYKIGAANDYSRYRTRLRCPDGFRLHSTPLNECIIASYDQIAKFKAETGREKINVIFLTDGEANGNDRYYNLETQGFKCGYPAWGADQSYMVITDRKTNKVVCGCTNYREITQELLKYLGSQYGVNVIGFFLTERREIAYMIDRKLNWDDAKSAKKVLSKRGYMSFASSGYDIYFMVNAASLDKTVEFNSPDKKEDGSVDKGRLRTAFKKFSKGRKVDKLLLNEFVSVVA